jgi:hypothetical protein
MHSTSNDIKLIVFDVDGTLVNDDQVLGEKTISAIRQLQDRGIQISLATGKIYPSVATVIDQLDIKIPIILANGALIQQPNQEIIFGKFLDKDLVNKFTHEGVSYAADMALFLPDRIYVQKETYNTAHISEQFKEKIDAIGEWSAVREHFSSVCKAIWINRRDIPQIRRLTAHLQETYDGKISLSAGAPDSIEAMPIGVSKKSGLVHLADHLQIPLDSVMAFGDQGNDLSMMESAGTAIAVGNAIDDVKEISDHIIGTNNEEGPAEFLYEYFSL